MPGPIVETGEDLVLRTVERDDAAFVQRLFTDPWARPAFHESSHKNRSEVEELLEEEVEDDSTAGYLACVDGEDAPWGHPEDGETTPVAFVVATHVSWDRPDFKHWVAPERRGDGHGVEALSLAIESVFRTYDANSIGTEVLAGNDVACERVEAVGFTEEGRNREMQFVEGEFRDLNQYGILRGEWE